MSKIIENGSQRTLFSLRKEHGWGRWSEACETFRIFCSYAYLKSTFACLTSMQCSSARYFWRLDAFILTSCKINQNFHPKRYLVCPEVHRIIWALVKSRNVRGQLIMAYWFEPSVFYRLCSAREIAENLRDLPNGQISTFHVDTITL